MGGCLLALGLFAVPQGATAQAEVLLSGIWASGVASGPYIEWMTEDLLGRQRADTIFVNGQPIVRTIARTWMAVGFAGVGIVDAGGDKGVEMGVHTQVALVRRFPGKLVDRAGLGAGAFLPQGGVEITAIVRLQAVFWGEAGAVRAVDGWHPLAGVRVPAVLLGEICRFVHVCRGAQPSG